MKDTPHSESGPKGESADNAQSTISENTELLPDHCILERMRAEAGQRHGMRSIRKRHDY